MTKNNKLQRADLPELLADNPNRLVHIQTVLANADHVESVVPELDGKLKQAALYHDIAYAPAYRRHGFHPLDAALLAEEHRLEADVVTAIKHHSGSYGEAQLCYPHLAAYYSEGEKIHEPLCALLTFCDLHSGAKGGVVSLDERLADIRRRHAQNAPLLKNMDDYEPVFRRIVEELPKRYPGIRLLP
jgi:hypothetical protein